MQNKTCGECKYWYAESVGKCRIFKHINIPANRRFCSEFERWENPKPTNGENIWQSGYEEVITFCKTWMEKFSCWAEAEEWLNAPAESEGNNE